jgi:hypothetical protein
MTWTPRHTLAAGFALILVTNAVVLGGAAYNRSGEPEAQLRLTEREFHRPYSWALRGENSGLALGLRWRVPRRSDAPQEYDYGHGGWGGRPAWLDQAKLASLGFDLSVAEEHPAAERHYDRQLDREVLLVLEFDGPAYQAALKQAELRSAEPSSARRRRDPLADEKEINSRLFAVDAGLDRASLRAKYPDRSRYAIAPGKVRIGLWQPRDSVYRITGYISDLSVAEMNVPIELHDTLGTTRPMYGTEDAHFPAYEATVAFGRRLEPWFVTASPRPKPATGK